MTEKICYTIERYVRGLSLAGTIKYAPVAQLDRALDSDSKGRWFESSRAYQSRQNLHVTIVICRFCLFLVKSDKNPV